MNYKNHIYLENKQDLIAKLYQEKDGVLEYWCPLNNGDFIQLWVTDDELGGFTHLHSMHISSFRVIIKIVVNSNQITP